MKYAEARIVVRRECEFCGGEGMFRSPGIDQTCPTCNGSGHLVTELLHPGEPFLLIRAQDVNAPVMVDVYRAILIHGNPQDPIAQIASLAALHDRVVEWQESNPGLVKTPD